jgi:hypothetical protein
MGVGVALDAAWPCKPRGLNSLINGLALLEKRDGDLYIHFKVSQMFFSLPHQTMKGLRLRIGI